MNTITDAERFADAAGLTADRQDAIPGQQTIDGSEVRGELPPPEEIVVSGPAQLGLFNAGGKAPQTATLKLKGGKARLEDGTAFEKGQRLALVVHVVIDGVAQKDSTDRETGIVVSCVQEHTARVVDFYVAE